MEYVFKRLNLLVAFAVVASPVFFLQVSAAQMVDEGRVREKIATYTGKAQDIIGDMNELQATIDNVNQFMNAAGEWLAKLDQITKKIEAVQQNPNAKYNGKSGNEALRELNAQRDSLLTLDGGTSIMGMRFTSMDQLKAAVDKWSKEGIELNKQYVALNKKLAAVDAEQDKLSAQLKEYSEQNAFWDKMELDALKESTARLDTLVNDNTIWCLTGFSFFGRVPYLNRGAIITFIYQHYMQETIASGDSFSSDELARRVKAMRDQSNELKKNISNNVLPDMRRKMAELEKRLNRAERVLDLVGCWIVFIPGATDMPRMEVVDRGGGRYDGYITYSANLKYIKGRHHLFSVVRTGHNVFSGTERNYSDQGTPVNNPLRITIQQDDRGATYRSDSTVQIGRCQ